MPPSRVTKKASPETASTVYRCNKCQDVGYLLSEENVMMPCDCGALDLGAARDKWKKARIPKKFEKRTINSFKADPADRTRMALKQMAKSYVMGFSEKEEKGLIFRGITGSGKTHLAVAILRGVIEKGYAGVYFNVTELLSELRNTYSGKTELSEHDFLEEVNRADLLVFDDLGAEATTDWVRDRLYLIINRRYEVARPTIITTNCSDRELADRLGDRIASRLYEMCMENGDFPKEDFRYTNMR